MFSAEKKAEARVARQQQLGAWLSKVVQVAPQHPSLVAFLTPDDEEDAMAMTEDGKLVAIGGVKVLDAVSLRALCPALFLPRDLSLACLWRPGEAQHRHLVGRG